MSALNVTTTTRSAGKSLWLWLVLPFAALVLMTVVFTLFDLDRTISGNFYRPGEGWYLGKQPLWAWLHKKGTIPGILLAVGCLLVWLLSYYAQSLKAWRKPCLVVVLTTVLGAGVLVNAILKQYWGRPRPSQTIEYGGHWEYRPTFPPGTPGKGASFPSGHSTMGFVFLAAAAFYPRSKSLAISGVATGVVLGGLLSAARVVQGAHFTSDTIWSFGLVGMTAAGLMILLPEPKQTAADFEDASQRKLKQAWITIATILVILIMAGGFLTRRPYYSTRAYPLELPPSILSLNIQIDQDPERFTILYAEQPQAQLQVDAHGFGWHRFKYRQTLAQQLMSKQLDASLMIEVNSYFSELNHGLTLTLPAVRKGQLKVLLNRNPVAR
jgi:membrane-associated PAP2 superfamily phosphatase